MSPPEAYELDRLSKIPEKDWWTTPKSSYQKYFGLKRCKPYKPDIDEYHEHTPRRCVVESNSLLHQKFKRLLKQWQEDSLLMSSLTDMVTLQSYRAIIGMGPAAVRLILNELKRNPDYLFSALQAITEVNPVLPEDEGNLDRMAKAWIEWGRTEGIIE